MVTKILMKGDSVSDQNIVATVSVDHVSDIVVEKTRKQFVVKNFKMVGEFFDKFGHTKRSHPQLVKGKEGRLRIKLILEEVWELLHAYWKKDLVGVADALTDILYVVYGAGHAWGIDLDACFREVHKSNMTKLGHDGKPIYGGNGKVMKGPDYKAPDIRKVLGL